MMMSQLQMTEVNPKIENISENIGWVLQKLGTWKHCWELLVQQMLDVVQRDTTTSNKLKQKSHMCTLCTMTHVHLHGDQPYCQ